VVCPWISTSCVALAAKAVRWRIEQDEEFREEVEHYTDAERVVLADAWGLSDLARPEIVKPTKRRFESGLRCRGWADARAGGFQSYTGS
jgi:hypothetical protein